MSSHHRTRLLEAVISSLEVPDSAYERARARHRSLRDWLEREASTIAHLRPLLYPQGSFRLGTAIRPIDGKTGFDVDQVCELIAASKSSHTQAEIRALLLAELCAYAERHDFKKRPKNGNRCVTLVYADEPPLTFHLDELPCVPEDEAVKNALASCLAEDGLAMDLAETAIAITDKRHAQFDSIASNWHSSNPRGYAEWFAGRARAVAMPTIEELVRRGVYARAEDVPEFRWKTPLQRIVQLFKRHRDIHFRNAHALRPISIVITTLTAHAFQNEADLGVALDNVVRRIRAVQTNNAHVRNPVNRAENFTETWDEHPERRAAFMSWLDQLEADVHLLLRGQHADDLSFAIERRFGAAVEEDDVRQFAGLQRPAVAAVTAPAIVRPVRAGPRPWGHSPR